MDTSSNYMENRDVEYETSNTIYDECYERNGIKCKNYKLCQHILPPDHYEMLANYLCMSCGDWFKIGGFGWNELEFRETEEECVVCKEINYTQVKFPSNCGHWFCISCSRNILFWDESKYHLSSVPYGCPPCPNGCNNPVKGKQCYCEEYDEIQNDWEQEHPDKYKEWNDAEHISIELSETEPGSVFGSKKCPLCRQKYTRK
jgi:hypothetical protein